MLSVAACVALLSVGFFVLTGRFAPIHKVETLHNPVAVKSWASERLLLADGRTVSLPGIRTLPSDSPALTELTRRGVEISSNGRVVGLARIHHGCGNDPVREHITRVDLAEALMFLHLGQTDMSVPQQEWTPKTVGGKFTEWGWNISEYMQFASWQSMKGSIR